MRRPWIAVPLLTLALGAPVRSPHADPEVPAAAESWESLQDPFLDAVRRARTPRDREARRALFDRIVRIRPALREDVLAAVQGRHADLLRGAGQRLAPGAIRGLLQRRGADLARARKEAIAYIGSESLYPTEGYTPRQNEEADRLVAEVESCYTPGAWILEQPDLQRILDETKEMESYLERCGHAVAETVQALADRSLVDSEARPLLPRPHQQILERNVQTARDLGMSEREIEAIRLINDYRILMGRVPLELHEALYRAAQVHTRDMVAHNFIGHTGNNGSTAEIRAGAAGYTQQIRENVSSAADAAGSVGGWRHSPPHHRHMLLHGHNVGIAAQESRTTLIVGE